MSIMRQTRSALDKVVARYGYRVVPTGHLHDWQLPSFTPRSKERCLPTGAEEYLCPSNAKLLDLQRRYSIFDSAVINPSVWTDGHVTVEDILSFRGDNAYVWQLRGPNMNEAAYALATYYMRTIDRLGLFEVLNEDEYFGNHTLFVAGKRISRDLLDSMAEILFLEKHLEISRRQNLTILDIGAGYGRLAHRALTALTSIAEYLCTDAVPVSTFISEFYLQFREVGDRARVVPLDEIERTLSERNVDIALNVHSFSECTLDAIDWWLRLLKVNYVKHLMVVPNSGHQLRTSDGEDFSSVLERYGYRLVAKEPKYRDRVVQQFGMMPAHHYLFELQ